MGSKARIQKIYFTRPRKHFEHNTLAREVDMARDFILVVFDMQNLKSQWYISLDLQLLQSAPALLGWSRLAELS